MSNILTKTMSKKLSRRTFLKASAAATTLAALGDKLLGGPVSTLVEGVAGAATEDVWIPTICYVCNAGPDVCKVHRVDGVLVGLEGNKDFEVESKSRGKVCSKPSAMLQKAYNPYRVKKPLKRTNPEKGIIVDPVTGTITSVDPGWVEISWDEALDTAAGWMRGAIDYTQAHPYPTPGYGNLGYARPSGGMGSTNDGTESEFRATLMNVGLPWDDSVRGGGGMRCYMSEHVFCTHVHGSGTGPTDLPHFNYNIESKCFLSTWTARDVAGEGARADARRRGAHVVHLSPYADTSQAYTDEWVPIKPRTDSAFFMAMAYVMVHEIGLASLDVPFLKTMTNSPYLVGPGGYFLRHSTSKKPLVWDTVAGSAKEYDDPSILPDNFVLEGSYTASGVEVRGFGVEYPFTGEVKPAYQRLKEHLLTYTPEWAAPICEVSPATIRRLADEFVTAAEVGGTIDIEGTTLPYRPVGITGGRGNNAGFGTVDVIWATHIIQMLVGALEVPGAHGGAGDKTMTPGADGMPFIKMTPWEWPAKEFCFRNSLVPIVGALHGTLHGLGPWMILNEGTGHNVPLPKPLGYLNYRSNPVLSVKEHPGSVECIKKFPWGVAFANIISETNEHCDILLPDNGDLETSHIADGSSWKWLGKVIRQRVMEPIFETREMGDILTELADRIDKAKPTTANFLKAYNTRINARLRGAVPGYPSQKLPDLTVKYPWDDGTDNSILNRKCWSTVCRHDGTTHYHSLAEYETTGGYFWRTPAWREYNVHLSMVAQGLRYNLPYSEYVKKAGEELQWHLDNPDTVYPTPTSHPELKITWWGTAEYTPLPEWRDPSIYYEGGPEYDLHCLTARPTQFAWANNAELPWIMDIAEHTLGMAGVTMNADAAAARGIKEGDEVLIKSPIAKAKGKARLVQGLRPDCIVLTGQMGHYTTPVAKERGWPTLSTFLPAGPKWVENVVGGIANMAMVKVEKV